MTCLVAGVLVPSLSELFTCRAKNTPSLFIISRTHQIILCLISPCPNKLHKKGSFVIQHICKLSTVKHQCNGLNAQRCPVSQKSTGLRYI